MQNLNGVTVEEMKKMGAKFGFDLAISLLKEGHKLAREGWNGKGMWLKLVNAYAVQGIYEHIPPNEENLLPWIGMKTADNRFVPWLASQTDMLVEDWMIVE
ncbi:DUF2829 domain-containing protein [Aneurinibacillus migulanus]|uniref:DUF2829 domain-containing protein n=1 Tax=Aneurinibacillus migulanus TaxID=47500 RepID=UPI00209F352C|nr:DUF2829 domain-containing protein [Aneurinibacillus migulanus]MCP1355073.1 DUF2829 domain-containing protein [Aneurinibacillus migulanus]